MRSVKTWHVVSILPPQALKEVCVRVSLYVGM